MGFFIKKESGVAWKLPHPKGKTAYPCFRLSHQSKEVRKIARLLENATHFLRAVLIPDAFSKSYGIKVHGEIPQGFSPRKLTVLPWKASDFPDLQMLTTITEKVSLETES
ncbi:hypothetical protein [Thalassobacillus cyri]|uniref:hypothetical protein n=1 Tax=Thalassobacillus cyri TaxID=571932 RepID=UPI000B845415|nr:hypothetical protein [Thalassobacillus cyri]